MKKWHTVLWVVFASMALSGVSILLFRQQSAAETVVARVNNNAIYFNDFRRSLIEIQARINSLRPLAQAYGMSEEMFLSTFLGATRPEELALDNCVKERLIDQTQKNFKIVLDSAWFKNELIKSLPQMVDENGQLNMAAYQSYLERLSTTPAEYEKRSNQDFKRNLVQHFIGGTVYTPRFLAEDVFDTDYTKKSFSVARFPLELFVSMAQADGADENALEKFYLANKESYRVGEQRKAQYWELMTSEYSKAVDVEPASVRAFYERHKGTLYRVAPKIKVRKILIKYATKDASKVARDLRDQAAQDPKSFAELAKKHSQDDATAATGGLVDFFNKGTHDAEFEKVAFRLKEAGDVSPVVKTKDGYEIIQLVDRIAASEKPFDLVKDDIAKTLKAKRSLGSIRSDLEFLMRAAREDGKALEAFTKEHTLKMKETGWISENDSKKANVEALLAKRLFSKNKQHSNMGYFVNGDSYVIYRLSGTEKSYIPSLKNINSKVLADYYEDKAEKIAKNTLKEARTAILSKKTTLQDVVRKYKGTMITTDEAKKGAKIKELSQDGALQEKLFGLTSPDQVLEYSHKDVVYLAQLKDSQSAQADSFEQEYPKIIKQEKYKSNSLLMGAFIASLHRNAKIEIEQKLLEKPLADQGN